MFFGVIWKSNVFIDDAYLQTVSLLAILVILKTTPVRCGSLSNVTLRRMTQWFTKLGSRRCRKDVALAHLLRSKRVNDTL